MDKRVVILILAIAIAEVVIILARFYEYEGYILAFAATLMFFYVKHCNEDTIKIRRIVLGMILAVVIFEFIIFINGAGYGIIKEGTNEDNIDCFNDGCLYENELFGNTQEVSVFQWGIVKVIVYTVIFIIFYIPLRFFIVWYVKW